MRVLTMGTFDLFHRGHVRLLKAAKEYGRLSVGVNSDAFVEKFKGRRPIMTTAERLEVVRACRYVDDAFEHTGLTKTSVYWSQPNLIVIGSDWQAKDYLAQLDVTEEWLDSRGIRILYVPYTTGISTTDLLRRGDLARERAGTEVDPGKSDVPISWADRDTGFRLWRTDTGWNKGGFPVGDVRDDAEPVRLGPCQACSGDCPCRE